MEDLRLQEIKRNKETACNTLLGKFLFLVLFWFSFLLLREGLMIKKVPGLFLYNLLYLQQQLTHPASHSLQNFNKAKGKK